LKAVKKKLDRGRVKCEDDEAKWKDFSNSEEVREGCIVWDSQKGESYVLQGGT